MQQPRPHHHSDANFNFYGISFVDSYNLRIAAKDCPVMGYQVDLPPVPADTPQGRGQKLNRMGETIDGSSTLLEINAVDNCGTEDADDQESEVTTGLSFDIEEFFDFSVEWNYGFE